MRSLGVLLLAAPLLAARTTSSVQDGASSCVGPYLDDQPPSGSFGSPAPTVRPGQTLTIFGHWYTDTCNDTSADHAPLEPLSPVRLTLRLPGEAALTLGEFAPEGHDMGFAVPIQIPATASSGIGVVKDDLHHTYRFSIAGA